MTIRDDNSDNTANSPDYISSQEPSHYEAEITDVNIDDDYMSDTTFSRLLNEWDDGSRDALNQIVSDSYPILRKCARHLLRGDRLQFSIQSTELVNQLYIILANRCSNVTLETKKEFISLCFTRMRYFLLDMGRKRIDKVPLSEEEYNIPGNDLRSITDVITFTQLLNELNIINRDRALIVHYKLAGFTNIYISNELQISRQKVEDDFKAANKWMRRRLTEVRTLKK
jgi:RNA polymerase sigma factor (sigma-70 family)